MRRSTKFKRGHLFCNPVSRKGNHTWALTSTIQELAQAWPQAIVQNDAYGDIPLFGLFQNDVPRNELIVLLSLFHELQPDCLSIPDAEGCIPLYQVCGNECLGAAYEKELVQLLLSLDPLAAQMIDDGDNPNPRLVLLLLQSSPKSINLCDCGSCSLVLARH